MFWVHSQSLKLPWMQCMQHLCQQYGSMLTWCTTRVHIDLFAIMYGCLGFFFAPLCFSTWLYPSLLWLLLFGLEAQSPKNLHFKTLLNFACQTTLPKHTKISVSTARSVFRHIILSSNRKFYTVKTTFRCLSTTSAVSLLSIFLCVIPLQYNTHCFSLLLASLSKLHRASLSLYLSAMLMHPCGWPYQRW